MTLKSFEPFTRLDAADLNSNNEFLQDQTVQPFADSAARGSAIATPTDGQVTTLADDKNLQTYYGQYRPLPFAVQAGKASITPVANASTGLAVTWAAGRFTETPLIVLGVNTTTTAVESITYSGVTTSGATIRLVRTNTIVTEVDYLVIQMSNTSSAG
jgi:hypothetical protein